MNLFGGEQARLIPMRGRVAPARGNVRKGVRSTLWGVRYVLNPPIIGCLSCERCVSKPTGWR